VQVLDLGSGNGSPIVPLAIAWADADCYACEVRERRVAFLQICAVKLRLGNLRVISQPAEQLVSVHQTGSNASIQSKGIQGRWDIVCSRAFAPPARLLPLASKLLTETGSELRGFLGSETDALLQLAAPNGFRVDVLDAYGQEPLRHVYRLIRQ
jgi:16S rRNA (guanine527-N7)-methyltransferase